MADHVETVARRVVSLVLSKEVAGVWAKLTDKTVTEGPIKTENVRLLYETEKHLVVRIKPESKGRPVILDRALAGAIEHIAE